MAEFLLSYDREDGDGGYVKVFFDQLADELARRRAGWDKRSVGYLDVKVPTGSRWPDRLSAALGTCRVFLALYSPRYFDSCYDAHVLAPATRLVDIATATNAFAAPGPKGSANEARDGGEPVSGPRRVYFVMAAATAQEACTVRKDPGDRYGAEPDEWMPYRPEVTAPLILHANEVAQQQDPPLLPKQERADGGDLVDLIKQAERKNAIVILLVDAWTALLPKYQAALRPYDDYYSLHTAVIVPTNGVDNETAQRLPTLLENVRKIFDKNFRGRRRFYRDVVTSLAEFRRELGEVLIHTQSQVFENADVQRIVSPGDVIARPIITGPGGS